MVAERGQSAPQPLDFLLGLTASAPAGQRYELRRVGAGPQADGNLSLILDPAAPALPAAHDILGGNWYVSVCPRDAGQVTHATAVWVDIDHPEAIPAATAVSPRPSALVSSGSGYHLYWFLAEPAPIDAALRLCKLAVALLGGDRACVEKMRVLRLPGTFNMKYDPPKPCELTYLSRQRYSLDGLAEALIAQLVAPVWGEGQRHAMALGLGATLARAGWERERVERVARLVCQLAGGDVRDSIQAAAGTVDRREAGQLVSAAALREALGPAGYKALTEAIGLDASDGDLYIDGVKIGTSAHIEADLADAVIDGGEWAVGEGALMRDAGTHWRLASDAELLAAAFEIMRRVRVIAGGEEIALTASVKVAGAVKAVVRGRLDARPLPANPAELLPLVNGVLNVATGELTPHDRGHCNRWVMPVAFDPAATCPAWERFLAEAAPAEAAYLQEWAGYALTAGNPWQRMLWLYGPSGTGKSTFLNVIMALLGDAGAAIQSDKLTDYALASIAGKRIAVCAELANRVLRTTQLKALVGSDPMIARHPFGRPFTVRFDGKLIWASNSLPPVDEGEGLWRRISVVEFTRVPERVNPFLLRQLEGELSGILNWALVGAGRLKGHAEAGSWPAPASVTAVVDEYREGADLFAQFAADELSFATGEAFLGTNDVYTRYRAWCEEKGQRAESYGPAFGRELRRVGLTPAPARKVGGRLVRGWQGAQLVPNGF